MDDDMQLSSRKGEGGLRKKTRLFSGLKYSHYHSYKMKNDANKAIHSLKEDKWLARHSETKSGPRRHHVWKRRPAPKKRSRKRRK